MKNTILKIAVFGLLSLSLMLVSRPAQAEVFGMIAQYKYLLGLHRQDNSLGTTTDSMGHGVQIDFMWSLDKYDAGTKIPPSSLGFSVAVGVLTDHVVRGGESSLRVSDRQGGFYKFSVIYESVFKSGLGLSAGLGGGHIIGEQEYGALGLTDLGIKYHTKNGLVFSLTTDLMFDPASFLNAQALYRSSQKNEELPMLHESDYYAFILGIAVGIGYYF